MGNRATDALSEYRQVNVNGTLSLAEQAAKLGVRRFVFLSSIKVNGEETTIGTPYTEADMPKPIDAYGQSKYEAEVGLHAIAAKTGIELIIMRPTMIYGPNVKGNFARLLRLISLGVPLPFKSVNNRRSMISMKNCIDLIISAALHERSAGKTFLMSDGEDLSTPDLLTRISLVMQVKPRLFSFPPKLISLSAELFNQREISQRLIGSLQVDIGRARQDLNWTPIQSVNEGLSLTVKSLR